MRVNDLWKINYGKLGELRIRALAKLSEPNCPAEERPVLRRICEIWKIRSDNECI